MTENGVIWLQLKLVAWSVNHVDLKHSVFIVKDVTAQPGINANVGQLSKGASGSTTQQPSDDRRNRSADRNQSICDDSHWP